MTENGGTIPRNIIVFGQTGAGKSSIINMLAGSRVAEVSSDASGCTPSNQHYSIPHGDDNSCIFWDTPGLNEDESGTVSSRAAFRHLLNLVKDHGVNLLIYCIRDRLVDMIRINYDLFWRIGCMEKVPIVLVVTGLEGKDDMDEWWRENQKAIKKMKMEFAGHACITSWKGRNNIYEEGYKKSAEKVWRLVQEHCRLTTWYMPSAWPIQAHKKVAKYMHKAGLKPWTVSVHNIILFGEVGSGKSSLVNMIVGQDVAEVSNSAQGCTFQNEVYEATIDNTIFNIYDTAGLNEGDQGRVSHGEAIRRLYTLIRQLSGVSLLICCMRRRVKETERANWILFNKIICGEKVPVIAVVTGLETYGDPDDWRRTEDNTTVFERNGMRPKDVGCLVSFRGRQNELADIYAKSQSKLRSLIMQNYLRQSWSEEKDKWFANIYEEALSTDLCFATRNRLDYSGMMRGMIGEFIHETGMEKEDSKKLEAVLLKAERRLRKGQ